MNMTVDNVTSINKEIDFLIKKFPNMYVMGKHFHITSECILDPYRISLSTPIVEVLVCTQYWVRKKKLRKTIVDNIEDLLKDDGVAVSNKFELMSCFLYKIIDYILTLFYF